MLNGECGMRKQKRRRTMTNRVIQHSAFPIPHSRRGFSLVELLTVIFIIGLLIAILVPSLSAARNATKKMTTAKALDSIKVGLEMFQNSVDAFEALTRE